MNRLVAWDKKGLGKSASSGEGVLKIQDGRAVIPGPYHGQGLKRYRRLCPEA